MKYKGWSGNFFVDMFLYLEEWLIFILLFLFVILILALFAPGLFFFYVLGLSITVSLILNGVIVLLLIGLLIYVLINSIRVWKKQREEKDLKFEEKKRRYEDHLKELGDERGAG